MEQEKSILLYLGNLFSIGFNYSLVLFGGVRRMFFMDKYIIFNYQDV